MAEQFASYHKELVATVVKTTHRVRVRVGSSAGDLMEILKNVPKHATVNEVIGDQDHEEFTLCGEVVFTEDQEVG